MLLKFMAMQPEIRQLVQSIHDCPSRVVMVTAGAGTQALSDLLGVPGATRTLLEAIVPYSEASFDEFLGQKPAQYVADETARLLAGRAFTRARWLEAGDYPVVGLACSATIVTDRPKRGQHRAHIATWHPQGLTNYYLKLHKGARDRAGEEDMVSRVMLNALARACCVEYQVPVPLLPLDKLVVTKFDFSAMVEKLVEGPRNFFGVNDHGEILEEPTAARVLLSGAFNPLHDGHLELAHLTGQLLNAPVCFELSVTNVDKGSLSLETTLQRISQFAGRYTIFISNAPTFIEKARLYPGATFIVGYDTAARILQQRYYDDSGEKMIQALEEFKEKSCKFIVAGRVDDDGQFYQASDLSIPPQYTSLFMGIPREMFRKDISSTELRRLGKKGSR